ncbi:pupal cuticle protein 36-like [Penaeus chinensis]|uniref:pupal cuticle protein 36-like n=1 Tax=Penaeus chinensis TaxID=139456 RepID=UPI001FB56F18|nr:pupal cuticle protein 36-like [Penaeus chinensis]
MKTLILISTVLATAWADLPRYGSFGGGGSSSGFGGGSSSGFGGSGSGRGGSGSGGCGHGQVFHAGRCVTPRENRKVYLYNAPPAPPVPHGPPPYIPEPTIDTNIVFIQTPEQASRAKYSDEADVYMIMSEIAQRKLEYRPQILISTVLATAWADLPRYGSFGGGGSSSGFGGGSSSGFGGSGSGRGGSGSGGCGHGQVFHAGRCVTPRENRKVYLYNAPPAPPVPHGPPPYIPEPTIDTNIVFIQTPEQGPGPDPIVIPPPQTRSVVYVLNKQTQEQQDVIEVPAPPATSPEVYFVNYADGENPVLPSGVDLQSALNAASQGGGQVIGGGAGGSGGSFRGNGGSGGFVSSGGVSGGFGGSGESGGFGGNGVGSGFGGSGGSGRFGGGVTSGGFGGGVISGGFGGGGDNGEIIVSGGGGGSISGGSLSSRYSTP